ncbi:MAG: SMC family ATPase [Ktedonobacteraceae bacterium]|nr:SMC family ATPase [Ktedonobacteraceae bacterium]
MLITRIELENIKSYRRIAVDLRRGTTAISGSNGAGKTTLVEAIGFALFGYLPYSQDQFVREGEKYGKVVVHLIGSDERPYTVERRCGSGARWLVHDIEANLRLEQRADVLDKLHDLFGIDRERPLDSLFRDALGVPQGTFTAIFLEPASKRKQTFDALLQIEDYKTAADNLLETQHVYREQMQQQQLAIQRLTYETRELAAWREQLEEARHLDEEQKNQHIAGSRQLAQYKAREMALTEQQMQLTMLLQRYESCKNTFDMARKLLQEREAQLQTARVAQQVIIASEADHRRYQQAQETLKRLRQDAQQRDALRMQQAEAQRALAKIEERVSGARKRLEEIAAARQRIVELAPLVEQQVELEKQRDGAMQRVERYNALLNEANRLDQQLARNRQEQEKLRRRIAAIEPLVPLAEKLQEHQEILTQLRIKSSERESKRQQWQEKQSLLRDKLAEREQVAEQLRKAERNLEIIEAHRSEAEEMPVLKERYDQLSNKKFWLEGNIEGYKKSRAQSAGGQCPLLHETCLNIKQRGIASLEFYFDGLLRDEQVQLTEVIQQQSALDERMAQIKKYADALSSLEKYTALRDTRAAQLQSIAVDVVRLEREVTALQQELALLEQVEQHVKEAEQAYKESKQADTRVRELDGLRRQLAQLQEQATQFETDIQERRHEVESLRDGEAQLRQIEADLAALNDPRGQSKAQQQIIAGETRYSQQLQAEQRQRQDILQQLQELQAKLTAYDTLDADIAQHESLSQQSEAGHQNYLEHIKEARLLPERETAYHRQVGECTQAEQELRAAEQAYNAARAAFDEQELLRLKQAIADLDKALTVLAQQIQQQQERIADLTQKISQAEALLAELESAEQEYRELEDLHTMLEQFRKLIKEAAPHVLKAMLNDISAEANRIFGEIMGDRSGQLSWQNDYEITLRRQGVSRTFAQLSGGEQMSAALAVRLALLKKLSTLNIAFFDEPTQNMDELRRMNLAEQIRRVRGFDQLIVISHDDTFEQGLDSLVRLSKENGETYLVSDNGITTAEDVSPTPVWG